MLYIHLLKQEFSKKQELRTPELVLKLIGQEENLEEQKENVLQWHPAFYAGIQIEFLEEAHYLEFESEHMLSSKPMQIDVLIIKKEKSRQLQKNIGRIFRTYNIVEYKSPEDYLSIDDFFKVYGYTCFYKSDTGGVNEISAEELTITFVCHNYPQKLIRYLTEKLHRQVKEREAGIYDISDELFPIQLIVQRRLPKEQNLWLRNLTNELKEQSEIDWLLAEYAKHKKSQLHHSVIEVIAKANKEYLEGGRKGMGDVMFEIFQPEIQQIAEQQAKQMAEQIAGQMAEQNKREMIDRFMNAQNISLERACEIAGITTKEYAEIKERMTKAALG